MQVPPAQGGLGAAFLQALQGKPRPDNNDTARDAAKPVARSEAPQAVEAARRSEHGAPTKPDGRNFPRGSFVDIRA